MKARTPVLLTVLVDHVVDLGAALLRRSASPPPVEALVARGLLRLYDRLHQGGVRQAVIADLFGVHSRTLRRWLIAAREEADATRLLQRDAIFRFIVQRAPVSPADIEGRFQHIEPIAIRQLLASMVAAGTILKSKGQGRTTYRPADHAQNNDDEGRPGIATLAWVVVYRTGNPMAVTDVAEALNVDLPKAERALGSANEQGLVQVVQSPDGEPLYAANECVLGREAGRQAPLVAHVQAFFEALLARHSEGDQTPPTDPIASGSTYSFDIWQGHPLEPDVLRLLDSLRQQATYLRKTNARLNAERPSGARAYRISLYMGQYAKWTTVDSPLE